MTGATTAAGSVTGCVQQSGNTAWQIGTANPGTANESSGVEFFASTVGYENIIFSYDHRLSNAATRTARIQYTLNGGSTWVNLDVDVTNYDNSACTNRGGIDLGRIDASDPVGTNVSDSWGRRRIDFSAIPGANNNPDFGVRILAAHHATTGQFRQANNVGTVATGGTWRFDNVTFAGTVILAAPTTQDSGIDFTGVLTNGFTINWTNGDGARRIVVLNSTNSFTAPANGTDPAANSVYAGSGEQVVFNGVGSSVTVTGLDPNTTYWARVYAYNGTGTGTLYNTSTATDNPNSGSTATAAIPTKLVVIDVNGGNPLIQNLPFSITVQSQDNSDVVQNVTADTDVAVSIFASLSGGSLSGTLTGTILAGQNSTTISGILYDEADGGLELQVARISGDVLSAAVTSPLVVLGAATSLNFVNVPEFGVINTPLGSFQVEAVRDDLTVATEFTGAVTLSVSSGPGSISGTLTQNAVAGVVTFNDIQFDTPGDYILLAEAVGLDDGFSASILITDVLSVTELVVPQYIGSKSAAASNTNRTPLTVALRFDNLIPNTTYKIAAGIGLVSDAPDVLGAGNVWNGTAFSGSTINNAFTTDGTGSSGVYWMYLETTGNSSRFDGGQVHNLRLRLARQVDPFPSVITYITTNTFTSLDIAPTALTATTADDGAYLTGISPTCVGGGYVLAFDNVAGSGAPMSVHMVRPAVPSHTAANTAGHPSPVNAILSQTSPSVDGDYALVIPIGANNPNGVRRVELRAADNTFIAASTDADGIWPGGANTTTVGRRAVASLTSADPVLGPDADGDNLTDCADNCPVLFGQQGDLCDDGDPLTVGDIISVDCVCEGSALDCEGTPGGPAVPGSPCDDGDAATGNDTWDANCECVGLVIDCNGVPGGPDLPGNACDDGDPTTFNDVLQQDCTCAGTPFQFGASDLVVLQAEASVNNTTATVVALQSTANNATPLIEIAIPGTGTDAIRISGSATSTGYVSRTDDRTLLSFNGHNSTNNSSNANTLNPRAVVTVSPAGAIGIATTYTGASGNQTRSSTALDNSNWFIADQGGLFTNGGTAASPAGNLRAIKSFGGVVYVGRSSGTAGVAEVATVSAPSSAAIVGLPGLSNNSSHQDFYLIQSGANGDQYDVLYTLSASSNTAGTIAKYSLVNGTWVANGTYATGVGGFGLTAEATATGAYLYLTTGLGALVANQVVRLTDDAGYNATLSIDALNNLVVYTAPAGKILKGIDFAPQPCVPAEVVSITSNSPICSNEELTLNVTASGSGTLSYSWSGAGIFAPNTSSASVTVTGASTGSYSVTVTNACGSDNASVSVTVNTATTNTTTESACDSFTWSVNGETYTASGIYTVVNGCATEILDLTISPSSTETTTLTECDSFTWAVNGETYTVSGIYTVVIDCVSYVLDLTIISCACEDVTLEFYTGNFPGDVTWQIEDLQTNTIVVNGNGMMLPPGATFQLVYCLPADRCYKLRVTDVGDGADGYQLRYTATQARIIDNTDNLGTGTSEITGNAYSFCLPMGTNEPIYTSCDKFFWRTGEYLVADEDLDVSAIWIPNGANSVQSANTGYEFWFFNPNGGYSFRRFRSHNQSDGFGNVGATRACHMRVNNWAVAQHIPEFDLHNVRVRARVNGVNKAWGPACRFVRNEALAQCPPTKLMDIPGNQFLSCNQFRQFVSTQRVHARPVSGANRYQWRFRIPAENVEIVRTSTTYFLNLGWGPLVAAPLQNGKTYEVDVRASRDGGATWCGLGGDPWGDVCLLTIGTPPAQNNTQNLALVGNALMNLWPNPNNGTEVWISLDGIDTNIETVTVDIHDLTGKRISARILPTQDGGLYTALPLNGDLAAGLYTVTVIAGEAQYVQRLVIQP
jgi:hypothetical protein